jgi:DNA-binding NarL/FixJ family response regulator
MIAASGTITWANAAWLRYAAEMTDPIAGAEVGANFVAISRSKRDPTAAALSIGVRAVLAGRPPYFEREFESVDGSMRWRFEATFLGQPHQGAVLLRVTIATRAGGVAPPPPDPEDLPMTINRLTPREWDVLQLMVRGLDNRQIAADLDIAYTTVRSYARSLIQKLGARSRLQAVARAYRAGIAIGQ